MKKNILLLLAVIPFITARCQQTVGLFTETTGSLEGYVLFAPIHSDTTYLIDKCGKKIHQWYSTRKPGLSVYLLPNGDLLKTGAIPNATFNANGAAGGAIEEYDWNGNLLWSYTISSDSETQNHDIYPLPNGNILVDIWEAVTPAQAIAAGRNPSLLGTSLWTPILEEIQPVGSNSANVVWSWRLWDHLVQDYDSTKANYGVVANHPELLDINFYGTGKPTQADWIHMNAVTYNATLDQVMFSAHNLSEIYILDHSTTTAEAASHAGGTHSKGGDFLYRWGNPQSYRAGTSADTKLFQQHNPNWIPAGYPGANEIIIFNNGLGRPGGNASSVDVILPPVDTAGNYALTPGQAYGPSSANWSYMAAVPSSFFSENMGSAQRLPNGNTIVCEATKGHFFELDSLKNTVWDYVSPVDSIGIMTQGQTSTSQQCFRCVFYGTDYSGFTGETLTPGSPIEINPLPNTCNMLTGVKNLVKENTDVNVANPFADNIFIYSPDDMQYATITLRDMTGRVVEQWGARTLIAGNGTELDLHSSLAGGIYILTIQNAQYNISKEIVHEDGY